MNLIYKAPFNCISGYATVVDLFLNKLPNHNINLYCISLHGAPDNKYKSLLHPIKKDIFDMCNELVIFPISVEMYNKNVLFKLNSSRSTFIYTMWESTRVNSFIVKEFNEASSIIVPCNWNKENFLNDGVSSPIHVIPLGVDPTIFKYSSPLKKDVFVFGTGNNDYRKRLKDVIRCFCRAFHPKIKDVKLRVKISPTDMIGGYLDDRIEITNINMSKIELANWYAGLDIFVSGVYAEGWGLMQHESMMCGKPVIAPCYAGLAEFLDDTVGYCLDYEEVMADGPYELTGGFWAKFNEDDMIDKMRWCYNNREEVYKKGILSYEKVKHLTEDNMINKVVELLSNNNFTSNDSFIKYDENLTTNFIKTTTLKR